MQLPASSAKQCVPCTAMKSWIEGVVVAPAETGIGASNPAIPSAIVATTNHRGVLPLIVPLLTESRFGGRPSTGCPHAKNDYTRGGKALLSDRQVSPRSLTGPVNRSAMTDWT